MNYKLNKTDEIKESEKSVFSTIVRRLLPLMREEQRSVLLALGAIAITSASTLLAPIIIAHTIDTYIVKKNMAGMWEFSVILFFVFIAGVITSYIQIRIMGGVGRRILFSLRNTIFNKLQSLPVAFFNQNKAGDLISRINNDTDKLNQFFSQALIQFISNVVLIVGAGILLLVINIKLGAASLVPAVIVLVLTQILSAWVKRANVLSLRSLGGMSAEISESLTNFKVIVAFNRVDYFRKKFREVNEINYRASISAGIANNTFTPIYTFASTAAQVIVISYGLYLISTGAFTIGLLIGFILYVNNFYNPLRQLAAVWSSLQLALAGLDRISEVLAMDSDMPVVAESSAPTLNDGSILAFRNVSFGYPEAIKQVLHNVSFTLEPGKTYALVGPTGGGKTTTASLMARLYDPTEGVVYLAGRDIKSYTPAERSKKIGFILQEPFLFSGTIRENILYGNEEYANYSSDEVAKLLDESNFTPILSRFSEGLETEVKSGGNSISLGQKQLIAFMRAVLRRPEILILDEASANIDTITEQMLEEVLKNLPKETTRVIIAHRLNTIENADEIFFVNGAIVTPAGNMEHAMEMLLHNKRAS